MQFLVFFDHFCLKILLICATYSFFQNHRCQIYHEFEQENHHRPHGVMVSTLACHSGGPGSIPRRGDFFFLIEDKKRLSSVSSATRQQMALRLFNKTVLYNSKILGDIIEFCNNKFFKSGDALSTGAIIQYANQYVYSGQSWV